MATLKNVVMMGLSTAIRLTFGLLTFSILARLLGPGEFGFFMLWLAGTSLITLLANFGFAPYVLKEIGAQPEGALEIMSEVIAAKCLLSAAILLLTACYLPFIQADARWVFAFLLMALICDSMTDILNVGYRATNRFSAETRVATAASLIQFGIVSVSVWQFGTVISAAVAFFCSRLCVTALTWADQRQYFSQLRPAAATRAIARLKAAQSYAYDFGLQSLIGHVDSIVLNHYAGPLAVGLHQAGMRIFLGGAQIANVLGNVFIPHLASLSKQTDTFQLEAKKLQTAFFVSGGIFGLVLAVFSDSIALLLYGPAFNQLGQLLPWFGMLFFIRFFAAGYGVILTVSGMQRQRAKANLLHWVAIAALSFILVPLYGNVGWLQALILGNVILAATYILLSKFRKSEN